MLACLRVVGVVFSNLPLYESSLGTSEIICVDGAHVAQACIRSQVVVCCGPLGCICIGSLADWEIASVCCFNGLILRVLADVSIDSQLCIVTGPLGSEESRMHLHRLVHRLRTAADLAITFGLASLSLGLSILKKSIELEEIAADGLWELLHEVSVYQFEECISRFERVSWLLDFSFYRLVRLIAQILTLAIGCINRRFDGIKS